MKTNRRLCAAISLGGFLLSSGAALAQPPDAPTPSVEQEYEALQKELAKTEATDPKAAIRAYQQFYEKRGYHDEAVAIALSSRNAQLYRQELGDVAKAIEIYRWAIEQYGHNPTSARLREELQQLEAQPRAPRVEPMKLAGPTEAPSKAATTSPRTLSPVVVKPIEVPAPLSVAGKDKQLPSVPLLDTVQLTAPPVAPLPVQGMAPPSVAGAPSQTPSAKVAPVKLGTVPGEPQAADKPPQTVAIAAPLPVRISPTALEGKPIFLPSLASSVARPTEAKNLAPVSVGLAPSEATVANKPPQIVALPAPLPNSAASFMAQGKQIALPSFATGAFAPVAENVAPIDVHSTLGQSNRESNARVGNISLALQSVVAQMRAGQLSPQVAWQDGRLNADSVLEVLRTEAFVSEGEQKLRSNLIGVLVREDAEKVAGQDARLREMVGDYFVSQSDARAVGVFETLVEEAAGVHKASMLYRLSAAHKAVGKLNQAAQTLEQAPPLLSKTQPQWAASTLIEAARLYTEAGQGDKAKQLYNQVAPYGDGWLTILSYYDQASPLVAINRGRKAGRSPRAVIATHTKGEFSRWSNRPERLACVIGL